MRKKEGNAYPGIIASIIFAGIIIFSSCEKYTYKIETINQADSVHFSADILPIFTGVCVICHGGSNPPNLTAGTAYSSLSTGGYISAPFDGSRLYLQVNSGHPSALSSTDRQKILLWVKQGAKNN